MTWIDFILPVGQAVIVMSCAAICGYHSGRARRARDDAEMLLLETKRAAQIAITTQHTCMKEQQMQPHERKVYHEDALRYLMMDPYFKKPENFKRKNHVS